jgi:hypothetical protein
MLEIERDLNRAAAAKGGLHVRFVTELQGDDASVRSALFETLAQTDFAVVDVSDNNPNVLFELGHFAARGVPAIILKSRGSVAAGFRCPIYIDPDEVHFYEELNELAGVVASWLTAQLHLIDKVDGPSSPARG